MAIVLTVDGTEIQDDVRFTQSNFISLVNGTPGTCSIVFRDPGRVKSFTIGSRILLTIDGLNVWAGYLMRTKRIYPFEAHSPSGIRYYELIGLDINVLFQKRMVYKLTDPTFGFGLDSPSYPPNTPDTDVLEDLFSTYLDLTGDDIDTSTLVTNVGNVNEDQVGYPIRCGYPWVTSMQVIGGLLAPVWYINPDRKLVWSDVDVETSDRTLTDYRVPTLPPGSSIFEDRFARTIAEWEGFGGSWVVGAGTGGVAVAGGVGYSQAHAYKYLTNPDIPVSTQYEISIDFLADAGAGDSWGQYMWMKLGGAQFDFWPNDWPTTTSPYDIFVELASTGWNPLADGVFSVVAGEWYTIKLKQDGAYAGLKIWKRSDPEPSAWLFELTEADAAGTAAFILELDGGDTENLQVDNVVVTGVDPDAPVPDPLEVGIRNASIVSDGTAMMNDIVLVGVGYGTDGLVAKRLQDETSITAHGRWQMGGLVTGVDKQATIDRIASSYINGSPASRRGHKDDKIVITCETFDAGLRAGQVVHFISHVWDYEDDIPIRQMRITWPVATKTKYELVLSHELDSPFSLIDPYVIPPIGNDPPPKIDPWYPPPIILPEPFPGCETYVPGTTGGGITDTFSRVVGGGWGASDAGIAWSASGSGHSSVNGHGAIAVSSPGDYYYATQTLPFAELDSLDVTVQLYCNHDLDGGWPNTPASSEILQIQLGDGIYLELGRDNDSGNRYLYYQGSGLPQPEVTAFHSVEYTSPFMIRATQEASTVSVTIWAAEDAQPSATLSFTRQSQAFDYFSITAMQQDLPSASELVLHVDDLDIYEVNAFGANFMDEFDRELDNDTIGTSGSGHRWIMNTVLNADVYVSTSNLYIDSTSGSSTVIARILTNSSSPWAGDFGMSGRFRVSNVGSMNSRVGWRILNSSGVAIDELAIVINNGTGEVRVGGVTVSKTDWVTATDYQWEWDRASGNNRVKVWAYLSGEPTEWLVSASSPSDPPGSGWLELRVDHEDTGDSIEFRSIYVYRGGSYDPSGTDPWCDVCGTDNFDRSVSGGWGTGPLGTWMNQYVSEVPAGGYVDGSAGIQDYDDFNYGWDGDPSIGLPLVPGAEYAHPDEDGYSDSAPGIKVPWELTFRATFTSWPAEGSGKYYGVVQNIYLTRRWGINNVGVGDWLAFEIYTEDDGYPNYARTGRMYCGITPQDYGDTYNFTYGYDYENAQVVPGSDGNSPFSYMVKIGVGADYVACKVWADGAEEPAGWSAQYGFTPPGGGTMWHYLVMETLNPGRMAIDWIDITGSTCEADGDGTSGPVSGYICDEIEYSRGEAEYDPAPYTFTTRVPYVSYTLEVSVDGVMRTGFTESSPADGEFTIDFDLPTTAAITACYLVQGTDPNWSDSGTGMGGHVPI